MSVPEIDPSRVRMDLAFLSPDLHRPGLILRMKGPEDPDRDFEPGQVIARTEKGLAAIARRYRALSGSALTLLLSPGLLAWVLWGLLWRFHSQGFNPFFRGYHVPLLSVYELSCYLVAIVLVTLALWLSYDSLLAMRSMGPDYRFFRDATPEMMAVLATETSTGSWPRTHALLKRGREFSGYRPLLDVSASQRRPDRSEA